MIVSDDEDEDDVAMDCSDATESKKETSDIAEIKKDKLSPVKEVQENGHNKDFSPSASPSNKVCQYV